MPRGALNWLFVSALVVIAVLHAIATWTHRDLKPDLAILDPPPSDHVRTALAFGDQEFLYRTWFLELQNAGDTGGRATPMRNYNYENVVGWLRSLRSLDQHAQAHDFLAAHYFVQTPKLGDVRRVAQFIVEDAELLPREKWYWLTEAEVIAESRLRDLPYALELAKKAAVIDAPEMPNWVHLFPAVLLAKLGRDDEARAWISTMVKAYGSTFSPEECNWVDYFLHGLPANPRNTAIGCSKAPSLR